MALDHRRLGLENKFFLNKVTQSLTYATFSLLGYLDSTGL